MAWAMGKAHLGNNVWISSNTFDQRLCKEQMTPTIALRDAMSSVYSVQEMAERSLEGATPVKASDKLREKKKKLTLAKREALLALYRAKVQQTTGSCDENFLDLSVSKQGRTTMREKLKEAGRNCSKKSSGSLSKSPKKQ